MLDGKVVGFLAPDQVKKVADRLRVIKINPNDNRVPSLTEIAYVPDREVPGLLLKPFLVTLTNPFRLKHYH